MRHIIASKDASSKFFEKRLTKQSPNRPKSAKPDEALTSFSPVTRKKAVSSKRTMISKTRYHFKREEDSFVGRLRPKVVAIDKERLFDDNIELKIKINSLNDFVVKQKTKMTYLEKEVLKRDDYIAELQRQPYDISLGSELKHHHILESLKNSNKDLKNELLKKDHEIGILKRNIKSTRHEELEIENHTYIDECTRLRRNLEDLLKERNSPSGHIDPHVSASQDESLRLENTEISKSLSKSKEEIKRLHERISDLEKELFNEKKNGDKGLKNEIQKLKLKIEIDKKEKLESDAEQQLKFKKLGQENTEKLEESNKNIRKQELAISNMRNEISDLKEQLKVTKSENASLIHQVKTVFLKTPSLFLKMHHKITDEKTNIKQFLTNLRHNNGAFDDVTKLVAELRRVEIKTDYKKVLQALDKIGGKLKIDEIVEKYSQYFDTSEESPSGSDTESHISSKSNSETIIKPLAVHTETLNKPVITIDEISNILKHISLRMQLHRLPKAFISKVLFGEDANPDSRISKDQLMILFENNPFGLRLSADLYKLCQFLLESDTNTISFCLGKLLSSLED